MKVIKELNGDKLYIKLEGRLDTTTSPELEQELKDISNVSELIFDFENLEYISSAGLRILLSTQKEMSKHGNMKIKNVNNDIMEVFEITGFVDILTVE